MSLSLTLVLTAVVLLVMWVYAYRGWGESDIEVQRKDTYINELTAERIVLKDQLNGLRKANQSFTQPSYPNLKPELDRLQETYNNVYLELTEHKAELMAKARRIDTLQATLEAETHAKMALSNRVNIVSEELDKVRQDLTEQIKQKDQTILDDLSLRERLLARCGDLTEELLETYAKFQGFKDYFGKAAAQFVLDWDAEENREYREKFRSEASDYLEAQYPDFNTPKPEPVPEQQTEEPIPSQQDTAFEVELPKDQGLTAEGVVASTERPPDADQFSEAFQKGLAEGEGSIKLTPESEKELPSSPGEENPTDQDTFEINFVSSHRPTMSLTADYEVLVVPGRLTKAKDLVPGDQLIQGGLPAGVIREIIPVKKPRDDEKHLGV